MINGKPSALRWVLEDDWGMLDTEFRAQALRLRASIGTSPCVDKQKERLSAHAQSRSVHQDREGHDTRSATWMAGGS
jgi:hypothetical protein